MGRSHWVNNPDAAADLRTIQQAAALARTEIFENIDIVVTHGDPLREVVLPLRRKWGVYAEPLQDAA